ncbi:ATP-binding protein [Thalassobellus suaedae]|uniref:histidine kinase n=1 Tax=Thalassobellus suaedae TaxID=3074124 RepID=A0ABY9XPL8_9FLAO|nr:PAS domain-containing sensor histidine kinase [Flavobacteriaceae bacterium HL-DH14]
MSKSSAENNLRAKAEAKIREKSNVIENLTLEESKSLLHELEVHQVELEMQNEELRETQHRLEEIRDQYTDLFDFAPIGYLVLDEKAIIKNINLTACDLLGIERSFLIEKPFSAYITNGESRTLFLNLRKAFETGILHSFEIEIKHKTKGSFTALLQGAITKNQKTNDTVCRVSLIDITELKEAEILQLQHKSLQKEKEKIQEYLNLAPVVFLLIDPQYKVQMINKKGCDLLKCESSEILGKHWFDNFISFVGTNGVPLSHQSIENENGLLNPCFESFLKCRNDELRLMFWTNVTLLDDNNKLIGTLIAGEDITERKKLELRQQKYTEELEEIVEERTKGLNDALKKEKVISEMKSAFVSMASHEFRTPLTSVLSSAILINKYNELKQYDKVGTHVQRIESSVNQLTSILEDFLSMEKLERGIVTTSKETFDLEAFIIDIIEEFSWMLKEKQKINYIQKSPIEVFVDKKILRNVLLNLISNATKYSKTDVQIRTYVNNAVLHIEIEDKGIGIPEKEQEYLFAKFFRAKNAVNIQGTGLGLSIVKHYIKLINSTISFTSKLGEGSTFKLTLPLHS